MKIFFRIYLIFFSFLLVLSIYIHLLPSNPLQEIEYSSISPTSSPTPQKIPSPRPRKIIPTPTTDPKPWGIAEQIGEYTWTMKINMDPQMATAEEILSALNEYRRRYGSQALSFDSKLVAYAQSRVDYFNQIKNIDSHVGFNNFLEKEDGFNKLGFTYLGENISYGYRLNGVHLIEWIYAGDEPHNKNQLDSKWDHIGIAVKGTATCLIFATGKI